MNWKKENRETVNELRDSFVESMFDLGQLRLSKTEKRMLLRDIESEIENHFTKSNTEVV